MFYLLSRVTGLFHFSFKVGKDVFFNELEAIIHKAKTEAEGELLKGGGSYETNQED